jgi:hypothetical protein
MLTVPPNSVSGYSLLFAIENSLRHLIIDEMSGLAGARWYKQRLPPDLQEKYLKGVDYEKATPWSDLVCHHPIYYLDFPDLRKIIEKKDNWRDCFAQIFGSQTVILGQLSGLEPIRNRLAHNRLLSSTDLALLSAAHETLKSILGRNESSRDPLIYSSNPKEVLASLRSELMRCAGNINSLESCKGTDGWQIAESQWWFDRDYLSTDLSPLYRFYELVAAYGQLPRSFGCGHILEKWRATSEIKIHAEQALFLLDQLTGIPHDIRKDN